MKRLLNVIYFLYTSKGRQALSFIFTFTIIFLVNISPAQARVAVQEITGTLTPEKFTTFFDVRRVSAGERLFVFLEATSGDLKPSIFLEDLDDNPVQSVNTSGDQTKATLQHTFSQSGRIYRIRISGLRDDGTVTSGDYRLLVGINAPKVLTGDAVTNGSPVLKLPVQVRIGVKMQQITQVDQKSENFGVVASLMMEWDDPKLAFNTDECQCRYKIFKGDDFNRFSLEKGIIWPDFTIFNQQGNRWIQNRIVVIWPDGKVLYFERFSVTLQAPDFDFRKFPFDTQQFFIRVDSVFPEEFVVFTDLEGYSEVGKQLGEEEWIITKFDTHITTETASTQRASSRFSFRFEAHRHLNYYIFRIILPLLIIILVSWFTFFLKDYGKRVDVAGANLLLFVAFNFTISNDLPRLGYLTFMDTIIVSGFIVTSLTVITNVYLKRKEVTGMGRLADQIDKYGIWVYPFAYIASIMLGMLFFS